MLLRKIACGRGLTLVELLVVIVILGLIAAVAVPAVVTVVEEARQNADQANAAVLNNTLQYYYLIQKEYPVDLDDLTREGFLDNIPPDPWRKNRRYTIDNNTVEPLGAP